MHNLTYREKERISNFCKLFTCLALILLIACFTSPAMSGEPVGNVYFYDVKVTTFSVVWEVDEVSDYCDVLVYSDNSASPTLVSGYQTAPWLGNPDPTLAQQRGIMQVVVTDLPAGPQTFYVQTRSRLQGSSEDIDSPAFTSLIPVTTEPSVTGSPQGNGTLQLALYEGSVADENLQCDGVLAIVDAGGDYPVVDPGTHHGWPYECIIKVDLAQLRLASGYVDWTPEPRSDHDITIIAFGGKVPGNNVGTRIIDTTFPQELIGQDDGCVSTYLSTALDCYESSINQLALLQNQAPEFDLADSYDVDRLDTLTIDFCASDPEGDAITFTLGGDVPTDPNMTLEVNPSDANCATITWTPTVGGFYKNIKITATDGTTPYTETFEVVVSQGAPVTLPNVVSIEPTSGVYTDDDLKCTVDSAKILNPDPGDVGTESINYKWYMDSGGGILLEQTNPTPDKYESTLSNSLTAKDETYYCMVTVSDSHGAADPVETAHVAVLNSPPTAPTSVDITPAGPVKTTQALTCTAGGSTDEDTDPIQYKFVWTSGSKTPVDSGYKGVGETTDVLQTSETDKGDTWICTVTAYDGSEPSATSTPSSNSVSVENTAPTAPGSVTIGPADPNTTSTLTCSIGAASTDDDTADSVEYIYQWTCTDCDGKTEPQHEPGNVLSDTLDSTKTAKGENWSCEVWATDGTDNSSSVPVSANTIQNTAPTNLTAAVTPTDAYVDTNLVCTVTGPDDPDVDDGADTITYDYVWTNGTKTVPHNGKTGTTDTLLYTDTNQNDEWECTVTATDESAASVVATSNSVLIVNRPPDVTTDPAEETQVWDEEVENTLEISADDPDGDNVTIEIDTNYADPNDALLKAWLTFDDTATPPIVTATPPVDSSGVDFGFGTVGILEFKFIITDDGTPSERVEKMITVVIQPPVEVVDDFEYLDKPENQRTLALNNWVKLQGSGTMQRLVEDGTDPNNHFMKTTVSTTPSNNSQLGYIVMKTLTDNAFTNEYPRIRFFIKDQNLYYFDAYVRAKNAAGAETNYFVRYVPQAPGTPAYSVSGKYVTYKIGTEYRDSNGREVVRNMDDDLFNATGYRYMYLKAIVLRGDIDFIDNIVVSSGGPPPPPPKEVKNLTAQGSEDKVTLSWQLDANQTPSIAGYRIYMQAGSDPGKVPGNLKATVSTTATAYTATGLTNDTEYYFRVTAFDNLYTPTESAGVLVSATPAVTIPLPPLNLQAESLNGTIILTWKNDPNQHLDLAGYKVFFGNCPGTDSCAGYVNEMVLASAADATGGFTHYINKDASGNPLQYGETYNFTVKAIDSAATPNLSSGVAVSITLAQPASKLIDNFDVGYAAGDTLAKKGWYKLQGSGAFTRKSASANNYMEMKSSYTGSSITNFIINKWLTNPTEFNNPIFKAKVRSAGDFRIDLYVKGKDGKNYFLSYKGDKATAAPGSSYVGDQQVRWFVYKLNWGGNQSTEWYDIERDLEDDLQNAKGVGFDYVMGILLRGTMDIDDIELGQGVEDVVNLTARPSETEVLLSWTVVDPNNIDNTKLYIDTNLVDPNMDLTNITGYNDYQYNVTGLTTGTTYEFKIVQEKEGEESKGVSVSATPMVFKATAFTFDNAGTLTEWTNDFGVELTALYSSGIQSNVMYLNPSGDYPDRYYVYADANESDVTGMKCHFKTDTNFVIWVDIVDTTSPTGLPFMVGFVPGGTANDHLRFGNFAYYYLGSGYTDGEWQSLNINLDNVLNSIFTGLGTDTVNTIYFGGRIYVDDIMFY